MKFATSARGMVVAAHPLAAEAGARVLEEGGNAADAAVAVSLVLNVVEPQASGLGGGGFMMIRLPDGRIEVIDSRSKVSSLLTADRVYSRGKPLPWVSKSGPMSIGVPGLGRALDYVLRTYGSKPLRRLVEPAIRAAEEGFEVSETFRHCANMFEGVLRHYPETCAIYMKDGRLMKPGERLVQKDLAKTLRRIADVGFEDLYTGELGRRMTAAVNQTGPVWGQNDLAGYTIEIRRPLRATVEGYEIATTPPPSRGGVGILQTLLRWRTVRPKRDTVEYITFFARTFREIFTRLDTLVGDPALFPVTNEQLLASPGTTHYSIVDRAGTIVTASQTIGHFFGSGLVVPGTGILLNDDLTDMDPRPGRPNSIDAGKRPVANMAPTIVERGGRPAFALGTPGATRIFPALSQVIANVIGYGMSLEAAVAAPRVHWEAGTVWVEGGIPAEAVAAARKALSEPVEQRGCNDLYFGGVHAVAFQDGRIVGVADPRRDGVARAVGADSGPESSTGAGEQTLAH